MALESFRNDGFTFDVSDSGGDGDPVIMLHGFPQSRSSWDELTPHLVASGYRVLAPDQRGYSPGARPTRRRDYTMDKLESDVVALADAIGAERFHVVGHDWGGAVAWSLGANQRSRVATVTSLSTPHPRAMIESLVSSDQFLRSWYMLLFQLPVLPEQIVANEVTAKWFGSNLAASGLPQGGVEASLKLMKSGVARGGFNWYRALPFNRPSSVGDVGVPALYVYGDSDFALGAKAAELTRRHVSGPYRFVRLVGAGHWLPDTESHQIAPLLLEHLDKYHL